MNYVGDFNLLTIQRATDQLSAIARSANATMADIYAVVNQLSASICPAAGEAKSAFHLLGTDDLEFQAPHQIP